MFFAPVIRRAAYVPAYRSVDRTLERFLSDAFSVVGGAASGLAEDDKAYTLTFDVPGITREQLNVGIEANVVRIETLGDAARQYKAAYELPMDIDVGASEAKLENGVLTLKLAKKAPVSKVAQLAIN